MANFSLQNYGVFTDLLVKNSAEIEGNLLVDGDLTLGPTSTLVVPGSVDIGTNLFVGGSEAIVGDLAVGGSEAIVGDLAVGGTVSIGGAACLSDQANPPPTESNAGCFWVQAGNPDTPHFKDNQGNDHQLEYADEVAIKTTEVLRNAVYQRDYGSAPFPPDNALDVGTDTIVMMVNSSVNIFNKSTLQRIFQEPWLYFSRVILIPIRIHK